MHHQQPGDVLRLTDGTLSYSAVVSLGGVPEFPHQMSLTVGTAPLVADQVHLATQMARPAFVLGGQSILPSERMITREDLTGAQIRSTLEPSMRVGGPESYGAASSPLGFGGKATNVPSGHYIAPQQLSLAPCPVVLMELLKPQNLSRKHIARTLPWNNQDTRNLLAKLIITNGFARISEEMTHQDLTSIKNVRDIQVRFMNADDYSLVDWQGREHFWSLLLRVSQGTVDGPVVMG